MVFSGLAMASARAAWPTRMSPVSVLMGEVVSSGGVTWSKANSCRRPTRVADDAGNDAAALAVGENLNCAHARVVNTLGVEGDGT